MGDLKFYFFGALKETDVFRYPIDKKAFEIGKDWLEKLIYENNPENIIDYRKIMTFEVFNRTDIVFVKAAEIKEGLYIMWFNTHFKHGFIFIVIIWVNYI